MHAVKFSIAHFRQRMRSPRLHSHALLAMLDQQQHFCCNHLYLKVFTEWGQLHTTATDMNHERATKFRKNTERKREKKCLAVLNIKFSTSLSLFAPF